MFNELTKYSSVNSMSKIDFAPAHTTATGVLPSSVRSVLISNAVETVKQGNMNYITLQLYLPIMNE